MDSVPGHACRLRRRDQSRGPAGGPGRGRHARPDAARRLDDRHRQGRRAEPPRPVVAARRGPGRRRPADDPRLRRGRPGRGRQRGHRARGDHQRLLARRRDARSAALAAVRALPRRAGREGGRPGAQHRPQAARAVIRARGLPAHGVAHRLPHALHPRPGDARDDHPGPGCRRRRGDRADRAGQRGGRASVGHQPLGGQARRRHWRWAPTRPSSPGLGCPSAWTRSWRRWARRPGATRFAP